MNANMLVLRTRQFRDRPVDLLRPDAFDALGDDFSGFETISHCAACYARTGRLPSQNSVTFVPVTQKSVSQLSMHGNDAPMTRPPTRS